MLESTAPLHAAKLLVKLADEGNGDPAALRFTAHELAGPRRANCSRSHEKMKDCRRFQSNCVCSSCVWARWGTFLHSMPAVTALRQAHPDWVIGWAIEPQWRGLFCANGCETPDSQYCRWWIRCTSFRRSSGQDLR